MTTSAYEANKGHDANLANTFLDDAIKHLGLKNDAALCRVLGVAPPVVSKVRHGTIPLGASYLIRFHELTNWPMADIKRRLGIAPYTPQQFRQQAA